MFLKLLEAVLRTGNRMNVGTNRGEAKAFKLDTLLKLADVKGTDGKTTLLRDIPGGEGLPLDVGSCVSIGSSPFQCHLQFLLCKFATQLLLCD